MHLPMGKYFCSSLYSIGKSITNIEGPPDRISAKVTDNDGEPEDKEEECGEGSNLRVSYRKEGLIDCVATYEGLIRIPELH